MNIVLVHKHFTEKHLLEVMKEMEVLGKPEIRAIWSEMYSMWLAVEGCHRLRAAKKLGYSVNIIDVSHEKVISIEEDGRLVKRKVIELLEELQDNAPYSTILHF